MVIFDYFILNFIGIKADEYIYKILLYLHTNTMSVKMLLKCNWVQKLESRFCLHTKSFSCMRSPFPHAAVSCDEFQIFCLPAQRYYEMIWFFGLLASS